MATKTPNEKEIIEKYIDFKLTQNKNDFSVYAFCKNIKIDEGVFYKHFSSINDLEKQILLSLFNSSLIVLQESEEYLAYSKKEKLIGFYYTLFETLKLNRSIVLTLISEKPSKIEQLMFLHLLKTPFLQFFAGLDIETKCVGIENLKSLPEKSLQNVAWGQFLMIFSFWTNDNSIDFEKTDIFIEKSLGTSFNLLENQSINDLLDLGKFLWKEKKIILAK
jgi:hypothetical protein